MDTISLSIDGEVITAPAGTSVLEAADKHGIFIPRLCHHPHLKPFGACRLCIVEDEKTKRLLAACVTPVGNDMSICTQNDRILRHRRNIIKLMIAEHPESCVVCSKGNRCELRLAAARLGVGETNLYPMPNHLPLEQANPFITRDLSKCILCGKCIRADHELVVTGAIDYSHRGFQSRPATAHYVGLERSNCTFCGTCVSICPTGALSAGMPSYVGTPEHEVTTVCGFCGVGCRLAVGSAGNRLADVNPAVMPDSANKSTLCVRGHFANDYVNTKNRLVGPRIRDDEQTLISTSWDSALDLVANRLTEVKKTSGSQSIAFLGSSKCTNEENYLFHKLARGVFETNNIDNGGSLWGASFFLTFDEKTDGRWRSNSLEKLEQSEAILLVGADPSHSVPVVSYCLKRAAKKGIPLVVIDPRQTELARFATLWLPVKPDTDLELINGLTALLHEDNQHDSSFIDQYTDGFNLFRYGLTSLDIERVCQTSGIEKPILKQAADILKDKKISIVVGNGVFHQRDSAHTFMSLFNLALMTGSLGPGKAGFYMLAKENNQVGAMDMGAAPAHFPGRNAFHSATARSHWEKALETKISPDPGLNMVRMIEEAEKGNLKAMYIMGENPLCALPDPKRVRKALGKLEFLVVQDIIDNDLMSFADVVLPGAAFSEKAGTFTNLEGRIQHLTPVVEPPGYAKQDWEILDLLLAKTSKATPYEDLKKIRQDIVKWVPMYADLRKVKDGWIKDVPRADGSSPELIPFGAVTSTGNGGVQGPYPYTAIFGTERYHAGSGTRTGSSFRIQKLVLEGKIGLSPEDAKDMGLSEDDTVVVVSSQGEIERKIRIENGLHKGHVFIPLGEYKNSARALLPLTDLSRDDSDGWNICNVLLRK